MDVASDLFTQCDDPEREEAVVGAQGKPETTIQFFKACLLCFATSRGFKHRIQNSI